MSAFKKRENRAHIFNVALAAVISTALLIRGIIGGEASIATTVALYTPIILGLFVIVLPIS